MISTVSYLGGVVTAPNLKNKEMELLKETFAGFKDIYKTESKQDLQNTELRRKILVHTSKAAFHEMRAKLSSSSSIEEVEKQQAVRHRNKADELEKRLQG